MADLFTRLSERALEMTPSLRPVIPSRFAYDAQLNKQNEAELESQSEPELANKETSQPSGIEIQQQTRVPPSKENDRNKTRKVESIQAYQHDKPKQRSTTDKPLIATDFEPSKSPSQSDVEVKTVVHSSEDNSNKPLIEASPPLHSGKPEPYADASQDLTLLPLQPFDESKHTLQTQTSNITVRNNNPKQAPATPPTIKVTIGRIEVKAITPTKTKTAARSKRNVPTLSLNEYLAQRNGGQR